jgi:hypothetical protein
MIHHPTLSRYLCKVRDYYVDKRLRARKLYNGAVYRAPVDPYELVSVDPARITSSMTPFDAPNRAIAGTVVDGSWDRETYDFRERDGEFHLHTLDSFEKRFLEGWDWEETPYYRTLRERIRGGEDPSLTWGHTTETALRERCERIDSLFENVKRFGYKSQAELQTERWADPMDARPRLESYRKVNGEVAINIGRDGEYVFYDGRHRLAIAKILELDAIPVVVLVRHRRWQRKRDELANRGAERPSDRFAEHADVRVSQDS